MSGVGVAIFLWGLGFLYQQQDGSSALPWYAYVFVALAFLFYACYRTWLDQGRDQEQEIIRLQDIHKQIEDALRQQITTLTGQFHMRARHREQREALARFIEKGVQFRQAYETLEPVPETTAVAWEREVRAYLEQALGHDYAVRFQRPHESRLFDLNLRPADMSKENYKFFLSFNMRLAQLEGFIKELGD